MFLKKKEGLGEAFFFSCAGYMRVLVCSYIHTYIPFLFHGFFLSVPPLALVGFFIPKKEGRAEGLVNGEGGRKDRKKEVLKE